MIRIARLAVALSALAVGCGAPSEPAVDGGLDAGADGSPGDASRFDGVAPLRDGGDDTGPSTPSCHDMVRNGDEVGVDCGGPTCPACDVIEVADYYVSPDGSDTNPGTIDAPFATWRRLNDVLVAGQLAYIRGGSYFVTAPMAPDFEERWSNLRGTAEAPIRIFAYPGEQPVLDFRDHLREGSVTALYVQDSTFVHLRGLRITGLVQSPSGGTHTGLAVQRTTGSTFERLEVDHVGGSGFVLLDGAHDNLFLHCDAHHLEDEFTGYENANGFNVTGGVDAARNVFDGCRAWWICDDGFDLFGTDGEVTIRNSWSFWNGYDPGTFDPVGDGMGFKLGPTRSYCCGGPDRTGEVLRHLDHNLAFENAHGGFDQNGGLTIFELHNNSSYANGDVGFLFGYDSTIAQVSRNNLSYGDPVATLGSEIAGDHNSWSGGVSIEDADFESIDSSGMDGPRSASGELPVLPFLRPVASSDLVNAGADVGLHFEGASADIGCFER